MSRRHKLTLLTILTLIICTFCAWSLKHLYYSAPEISSTPQEQGGGISRQQIPKLFIFSSESLKETPEEAPQSDARQLSENEIISRLISLQEENLRRCYENHLRNQPDSRGEILIDLEITAYGKAGEIKITKSDFKDPLFLSCVQSVLKRIQYRNENQERFLITIPLGFD